MAVVGSLIRLLAKCFHAVADLFKRVATLLDGLLPVLLSPSKLTSVVKNYYVPVYSERLAPWVLHAGEQWLESWESEILDRYHIHSGRMLVLGSGWGREAIAIARRGITVVGIDLNPVAVRTAQHVARAAGLPANFHLANFLKPPYAPACWDYVLLADTMYSSIQGTSWRQTWLAELVRLLKPDGLLILSFLPERRPVSRLKTLCTRLNLLLVKLPGANRSYQPGDDCLGGHFLHAFQDEDEIRDELLGAGINVLELNRARGFAVVAPRPCTAARA